MTETPTDEVTAGAVLLSDEYDEVPDRLLHKRGCPRGAARQPVVGEAGRIDSVETYAAIRPGVPEKGVPPREITVSRCVDCGSHHVKESS